MIPQPVRPAHRPAQRHELRQSPLGGLDLASPVTQIAPGHAIRLDDWVCRQHGVTTRGGYEVVHEYAHAVASLLRYPGRVIAATATQIFTDGRFAAGGFASGDWMSDVIANAGGVHLLAVNGVDEAIHFDGASWNAPSITGVDSRRLFAVAAHQRRFFLAEKDSLNLWYLGLNAFAGPAQVMPLEAQFRRGGSIVAIGSDGQSLMIATQKELAVYQGTNPDDAGKWSLIGVWDIPAPVGRHCFAGDALLTEDGLLPASAIMGARESAKAAASASRMVDPALAGADRVVDSLSNGFLLIHTGPHQWIMSETGGWSRFTGFPLASCWMEFDDGLYFGTADGRVCRYGGASDNGRPIRSFAVEAPGRYGTSARKRFLRMRLQFDAAHPYVPRIEMLTDFRNVPSSFEAANVDAAYWMWPQVTWPRQPMRWMRERSSRMQEWRSISGHGVAGALMVSMQTLTPVTWTDHDVMFETGGLF